MYVSIHNAKKVTFDGRDCFIVCLMDDRGNLLFDRENKRYDPEATSEHSTQEEAINHAKNLAQRRAAKFVSLVREDRRLERIPL